MAKGNLYEVLPGNCINDGSGNYLPGSHIAMIPGDAAPLMRKGIIAPAKVEKSPESGAAKGNEGGKD